MSTASSTTVLPGRIPALDGLRAIAASLVVVLHSTGYRHLFNGGMAVEVFFVLSGFLVGGKVLNTAHRPGWMGQYYISRARRILPLYFVAVLIVAMLNSYTVRPVEAPMWMLWTPLANFAIALFTTRDTCTLVLWSIAVEEHFYLVLPAFFRKSKNKSVPLPVVLLIFAAISVAFRGWITSTWSPWYGYLMTPTRLDGLCIGVLLAWVHQNYRFKAQHVWLLATIGIGFKIALYQRDVWASSALIDSVVLTTLQSVATAFIILGLAYGLPVVTPLLSARPLVWVGTLSYGTYMLHEVPIEVFSVLNVHLGWTMALLVYPFTVGLALLSWHYLELPVMHWKRSPPQGRLIPQTT